MVQQDLLVQNKLVLRVQLKNFGAINEEELMENKEIGESLSLYMWQLGKFLTELMIVSNSTESPIIVQTFRAAAEL